MNFNKEKSLCTMITAGSVEKSGWQPPYLSELSVTETQGGACDGNEACIGQVWGGCS